MKAKIIFSNFILIFALGLLLVTSVEASPWFESNGALKPLRLAQTEENVQRGNSFEPAPDLARPVPEKPSVRTADFFQLTPDEQWILYRGEISPTAYYLGAILGTYPLGLGLGHAIQGRYSQKGWIFTVGELGSVAFMAAAGLGCWIYGGGNESCFNGVGTVGFIGLLGFKVWEIVDLWVYPPEHNRRLEFLKSKTRSGHEFQIIPTFSIRPDGTPYLLAHIEF